MAERSHITAVEPESQPREAQIESPARGEPVLSLEEEWVEEIPRPRSHLAWIVPTLAVLAILGWTGLFGWVHQAEMLAGASPQQWIDWTTSWAVPVLLVVALWLLAMRSSSREAARFGDAAKTLRVESARLEERLAAVNRELSLARDFIASQSRDLEALGRIASERLSQNAERLKGLIHTNSAQIDSIATVSAIALENMDKLRGDLPVIANSARDVTSQIGNAGRTAHGQLEELVSGFHRLNEFGEASERQVQSLRVKVDAALAAFEAQALSLDDIAGARFEALDERSREFRAELDRREVEALAAIRRRAEAMASEIEGNWTDFDEREAAALNVLGERLAALRQDSENFASELRANEDEALDKWGLAINAMREQLVDALREVSEIDGAALGRTRERLAALSEEAKLMDEQMQARVDTFLEGVEQRKIAHASEVEEAASALERRLAELDAAIAERQEQHVAHVTGLTLRGEALAERLGQLGVQLEMLAAQGNEAGIDFSQAIAQLSANLGHSQETLKATEAEIAQLTDASVRLLELIQAGATHSKEQLPQAIAVAQQSLHALEGRTREVGVMLSEAGEKGKELSEHVLAAERGGKTAMEGLEAIQQRLASGQEAQAERVEALRVSIAGLGEESDEQSRHALEAHSGRIEKLRASLAGIVEESDLLSQGAIESHAGRVDGLRASLAAIVEESDLLSQSALRTHAERVESLRASLATLAQESDELARRTQGELSGAIERLQTALRNALHELGSSDAIEGLAEKIGAESAEAIERAIRQRTSDAVDELERATAHAGGASREAARQLRDQLAKVDELASNLESRVQRARERAEEQVDNDFARRVALITESLNSNAIDISKALSNDVTDTAWASYLRGDRGIFTRRAVRLLDNSEARAIAEIYDRDHDFREHVSRYIHDFESMLRNMLSTRDGNALGVTLLSSDMGKLYVALAQAIERLRD